MLTTSKNYPNIILMGHRCTPTERGFPIPRIFNLNIGVLAKMSEGLVFVNENEVFTTTKIIAENVKMKHYAIRQLFEKYRHDFEECGLWRHSYIRGRGAPYKIYLLNEQQATLLITYLKNTDIVRKFKKELVRQFFLMREDLRHRKLIEHDFKVERRAMTDAIKELPDSPHKRMKYINYTNLIYKAVTGKSATELRAARGYSKSATTRDFLTAFEMKLIAELGGKVAVLIDSGLGFSEIKEIVTKKLKQKLLHAT